VNPLTIAVMIASGYLVQLRIPCLPMPWGCLSITTYVQLNDIRITPQDRPDEDGLIDVAAVSYWAVDEDNGLRCYHSFSRATMPGVRAGNYAVRSCMVMQ